MLQQAQYRYSREVPDSVKATGQWQRMNIYDKRMLFANLIRLAKAPSAHIGIHERQAIAHHTAVLQSFIAREKGTRQFAYSYQVTDV